MTEDEWHSQATHSQWMISHLQKRGVARTKAGRRKLRLFACGCCRVAWEVLPDDSLRDAVLVAERFADGQASKDELATAHRAIRGLQGVNGPFGNRRPAVWVAIFMAVSATEAQAYSAGYLMTATGEPLAGAVAGKEAEPYLCGLVRDIFGNPFRPVGITPGWQTSTALAIAQQMYDSRDFSAMPILADALMDAGCDNADILAHCRGDGPHVRGCWVVDLLLGKS